MPATAAPGQVPAVERPRHPLHALTTYELAGYRRQLERAIAYFGQQQTVPPVRADLQAALDAVLAEQAERAAIAHV
jgi:hypothetical protein